MQIKIYQIQTPQDKNRLKYLELEKVLELNGAVAPSIYRKIYEGTVGCQTLEGVYAKFNCGSFPDDYHGHSLFVSDVIETENGCFFCGNTQFEKIEFDSSKTMDKAMLRVICMKPGQEPQAREIIDDYVEYEKLVGEFSCTYLEDAVIVHHKENPSEHPAFATACNERGEMMSVPEDQDGMLSLLLKNAFAGGDSAINQIEE